MISSVSSLFFFPRDWEDRAERSQSSNYASVFLWPTATMKPSRGCQELPWKNKRLLSLLPGNSLESGNSVSGTKDQIHISYWLHSNPDFHLAGTPWLSHGLVLGKARCNAVSCPVERSPWRRITVASSRSQRRPETCRTTAWKLLERVWSSWFNHSQVVNESSRSSPSQQRHGGAERG